ncbi:hypothetical protein [Gelidibacter japonicus]|nr:hypothetical protein [Gelidibacter japonicus]
MRKIHLILILTLTLSCSQKQTDNRITKFENVLGERQTKALNSLVFDFEKNLSKIYPDLTIEEGYNKYLIDLISDSTTNWQKFDFQSDKTNKEFHQSGLYDEVYEYSYSHELDSNDSTKILDVNQIGTYMRALYAIKDSDSLIKEYWYKREGAGLIQNELIVDGILSSKPNFDDYFHKRIVVVEFSF